MGLDIANDKSKIAKAILESSAYDPRLNLETFGSFDIKIKNLVAFHKVFLPDEEIFAKYDKRFKIYAKIYKNDKALLKAVRKLDNE